MEEKDGFNQKEEKHSKPLKTESLCYKLWLATFHKKFVWIC